MSTRNIVKNIRSNSVGSNGKPKLPSPNQLDYGEIAVNYASGHETLSLKNDGNKIVSLSVNSVEDVKVNGSGVVKNKTADITMKGDTIPVSGGQYSPMTYPKPFDGKAQLILADKKLSEALKILETNISSLVTEVLDNEETSAAAIRKLAESAGTVDGSGNIGYQQAAGTTYISNATSVHDATVQLDSEIYGLETRLGSAESDIRNLQGSIGQSSGIEWVDLGLPNGTLWAKCNVGAFTETENGDYFMWGSTTPDNNHDCNWKNTPFNRGSSSYDSTYFQSNKSELLDDNDNLKPEFDAAYKATKGMGRMPTLTEVSDLVNKTSKQWVDNYKRSGVNGYKFTGQNGNSIFIPAAGLRENCLFTGRGNDGTVWTSSLDTTSNLERALSLDFTSSDIVAKFDTLRYIALPVRPVKNS